LLLAAALLLQVSVLHFFPFRGATLSPVLIIVVWYAMHADPRRAALCGFAAGFFEDMLAAGTGGAWTISTTLTAIIAGVVSRGFFADSMPLVAGIVVFATLLRMLLFWMVMEAQGYPTGLGGLHFHNAVWQALLNALAILIVMLAGRYRDPAKHLR
jgi:rod shape-determining protein MreD